MPAPSVTTPSARRAASASLSWKSRYRSEARASGPRTAAHVSASCPRTSYTHGIPKARATASTASALTKCVVVCSRAGRCRRTCAASSSACCWMRAAWPWASRAGSSRA